MVTPMALSSCVIRCGRAAGGPLSRVRAGLWYNTRGLGTHEIWRDEADNDNLPKVFLASLAAWLLCGDVPIIAFLFKVVR